MYTVYTCVHVHNVHVHDYNNGLCSVIVGSRVRMSLMGQPRSSRGPRRFPLPGLPHPQPPWPSHHPESLSCHSYLQRTTVVWMIGKVRVCTCLYMLHSVYTYYILACHKTHHQSSQGWTCSVLLLHVYNIIHKSTCM